jgi:transcriptional/translational regulatory protein YebC/TACO1
MSTQAAKAGGPDPTKNTDLARALKEAHHAKLPKDNIERALKKATEQSGEHFSTGYYEVYGHGGVGLIVATLTDNSNRANLAIRTLAKKSDVKMASSGSVIFNFDHKVTSKNQY